MLGLKTVSFTWQESFLSGIFNLYLYPPPLVCVCMRVRVRARVCVRVCVRAEYQSTMCRPDHLLLWTQMLLEVHQ